ncbi:unnamed protein product [Phytomonas sp. Hart1]|nr:unnamed protein product [Phytomonas sp. Hart1]|eukprot:CCW68660.1 unnamed protein product [Phytomonas sp. isolate Hart1]
MIREKVLGMGIDSATLLVKDTESNDTLRILRRVSLLGCSDEDVSTAAEVYHKLQKLKFPGIVTIHTVLVQGSFLSVVADFCVCGDLNAYLEDNLRDLLPENQVIQWLLSISLVLQSLHRDAHYPFYGLSLERLFLGNTGNILLGLPLPPFLYFKQITDRKNERVMLEKEYPPEALQMRWYHPNLSDVWHLGLIAQKLLSAQTQFSLRSSVMQQLVLKMMEPDLGKRMSLGEVIKSLQNIIDGTKLYGYPPLDLNKPLHVNRVVVPDKVISSTLMQALAPDVRETTSTNKAHPWAPHVLKSASSSRVFTPPAGECKGAGRLRQIHSALFTVPSAAKVSQDIDDLDDINNVVAHHENAPSSQNNWHRKALKQFEELQRLNTISPGRMRNYAGLQNGATGRIRRGLTMHPINTNRGYDPTKEFDPFIKESFISDDVDNLARQKNIRKHIKDWNQKRIEAIALNANQHNNLVVTDRSSVVIVAPRPTGPPPSPKDRLTKKAAPNPQMVGVKIPNPTFRAGDGNPNVPVDATMAKISPLTNASPVHEADVGSPRQGDQVQPHQPTLSSVQPDSLILHTPSTISSSSVAKPPPREPPRRMGAMPTNGERLRSPPAVPLSRADSSHLTKASVQSSILGVGSLHSASEASSRQQDPPSLPALPSLLSSEMDREVNLSSAIAMETQILTTLEWTMRGLRGVLHGLLRDPSLYKDVMTEVLSFVSGGQEGCLNPQRNEIFLYQLKKMIPNEALFITVASLCAQFASLERLNQSAKGQRHFFGSGKEKVVK